jgi:hypothetical protein
MLQVAQIANGSLLERMGSLRASDYQLVQYFDRESLSHPRVACFVIVGTGARFSFFGFRCREGSLQFLDRLFWLLVIRSYKKLSNRELDPILPLSTNITLIKIFDWKSRIHDTPNLFQK